MLFYVLLGSYFGSVGIKKEIPATAQPGFETQQTTAPIAQPDSAK